MHDSGRQLRIAVDIGGTFTDLAAFDESGKQLLFSKSLSTHDSLVKGIQNAMSMAKIQFEKADVFLHGSTIVINTLLERSGARTALLITEGFRDIYEIGRINRPDAYNLYFSKHEPLVNRSMRFEVEERLLADGTVHKDLNEQQVRDIAKDLRARNVEAVAIILLHSYNNNEHERRVKKIIEEEIPSAFVTTSHELSREYREFERASTVAANAYVGPRVGTYLQELESHLEQNKFRGDFYAVQSTGGLFPVSDAKQHCVRMLESGPAAGVIGAQAICSQLGLTQVIAFDMGGTTAKAGVINNSVPLTTGSALIGGYAKALPIQIPMIDIFEVGTGGGSIAALNEGGALRVGPRSAGSEPGPACYGRGGTQPTVTDANLVLGRIDAEHFLGGTMKLDVSAAVDAVSDRLAKPLNLDVQTAANGVLRIAVTAMSYAVKGVTTERGLDAGAFAMIVYGGAGPLHASAIARELGIRRVIIPFSPGHFSAYGMLFSDLRYDYVRSCFQSLSLAVFDEIERLYGEMEGTGRDAVSAATSQPKSIEFKRFADMRYVGQEHAVTVELPQQLFDNRDVDAIKHAFDEVHLQRYGTCAPKEAVQIVSVRTSVIGKMPKPPQETSPTASGNGAEKALVRTKDVFFEYAGFVETPVYDRALLSYGDHISGPALIEEYASTTVVLPTDRVAIDSFGNLDIEIGE
ncbi:MAG: hydantoinase/oxoprolinase family protein [Burkholderiaceae bacterium]|nr:MAG: hydantoinase/oxoprolinase family protein [Burkholderiaceae bacterium]